MVHLYNEILFRDQKEMSYWATKTHGKTWNAYHKVKESSRIPITWLSGKGKTIKTFKKSLVVWGSEEGGKG